MSTKIVPYAIYGPDGGICYVDLSDSEESAWQIYLGWPGKEEIQSYKDSGYTCKRVRIEVIEGEENV